MKGNKKCFNGFYNTKVEIDFLTNVKVDPAVRQCNGKYMPSTWKKCSVMSQLMGGSLVSFMWFHIDCWLYCLHEVAMCQIFTMK